MPLAVAPCRLPSVEGRRRCIEQAGPPISYRRSGSTGFAHHGLTIAEVTRTALEAHLSTGRRRRLRAAATGRSGRSDISERIEEIISSEMAS
jgi:hypothetical protein